MSRLTGIVGNRKAATNCYFMLFAQQYGGPYSGGICSISTGDIFSHRRQGLLTQVFSQQDINILKGHTAIGHISSLEDDIQPMVIDTNWGEVVICGDCSKEWADRLIDYLKNASGRFVFVIKKWMQDNCGPWAFLILYQNHLYAIRGDGRKPLCFGRLNRNGFVVASQENAIATIAGTLLRHMEPGEIVLLNPRTCKSYFCNYPEPNSKRCIHEIIFIQNPAARWGGIQIQNLRIEIGRNLGTLIKHDIDLIVPVPLGGTSYALGVAGVLKKRGLEFNPCGFTKVSYPRPKGMPISMVLTVTNPHGFMGKRILIINDTLQSGFEISYLTELCREAGAKEVYVAVASLKLSNCAYGGEVSANLVGQNKCYEQIAQALGADDFVALTPIDICRAINISRSVFCTECLEE